MCGEHHAGPATAATRSVRGMDVKLFGTSFALIVSGLGAAVLLGGLTLESVAHGRHGQILR